MAENPPDPAAAGMDPEEIRRRIMAAAAGVGEGIGLGYGPPPEDEGVDLQTSIYLILQGTRVNAEGPPPPEALREFGENFDSALAYEIEGILEDYRRLYTPSDWELETKIDGIVRARRKFERRLTRLEEGGVQGPQVEFIREATKKLLWAEGTVIVLAGNMISTATYYAEEDRLANIPKIKVTGREMNIMFHENLAGYETVALSEELINRHEIVEMQADAQEITLMVAAVQQMEYERPLENATPVTNPRERERMVLDQRQIDLITQVFATRDDQGEIRMVDWVDPRTGNHHPVPEEILNYFCMDVTSEHNKRYFFALMTSMVNVGALNRLANGQNPATIGQLVRDRAQRILENADTNRVFGDMRERYAHLISRTLVAMHLGNLSAGELGWGWVYQKTKWEDLEDWEKQFFARARYSEVGTDYVNLRVSELGSIYSVDDIPSPLYPERHNTDYSANFETASEIYWGPADEFRRRSRYERPDWSPTLDEYMTHNPYIRDLVNQVLDGRYENKNANIKGRKFGKMDERLKSYIKKYVRVWPTWVTVNGKSYAIPLFYPPAWYSLNFWRSIGDNAKKPAESPSIQERMWEGLRISKINFNNYSDHVTDWKNVNGAQMARFLVLYFLSFRFARPANAAYETYMMKLMDINTLKDWEKRTRLSGRAEDVINGFLGMLLIAPFAAKTIADKTGVAGLADPDLIGGKPAIMSAFEEGMATIINNALYAPKTKGLSKKALKNFNGTFAMFLDFYGEVNLDWALKSTAQTYTDQRDVKRQIAQRYATVVSNNGVTI